MAAALRSIACTYKCRMKCNEENIQYFLRKERTTIEKRFGCDKDTCHLLYSTSHRKLAAFPKARGSKGPVSRQMTSMTYKRRLIWLVEWFRWLNKWLLLKVIHMPVCRRKMIKRFQKLGERIEGTWSPYGTRRYWLDRTASQCSLLQKRTSIYIKLFNLHS